MTGRAMIAFTQSKHLNYLVCRPDTLRLRIKQTLAKLEVGSPSTTF